MKSVSLKDRVFLRNFETKIVYNAGNDEFYEIDEEAFQFFLKCNGRYTLDELKRHFPKEEIDFIISERLIEERGQKNKNDKSKLRIFSPKSPKPSLRYILIHITNNCNLKCKHCYVDKKGLDMPINIFQEVVEQFFNMGGLKVMVTGGEPLLHPDIEEIFSTVRDYDLRLELLTNGTLIDSRLSDVIKKYVDEVQVSIDGIDGHKQIRGGNWLNLTIKGLKNLEVDFSISTMVTRFNIHEFDETERLVKKLGAKRWLLDYPCTNAEILPSFEEGAKLMGKYGYGKESYESSLKKTCGAHLCAVTPEGNISRCGFYEDKPVGNIKDGLWKCWKLISEKYLWDINELKCGEGCKYLESCKGGCRYRAEYFGHGKLGEDPLMCKFFENIKESEGYRRLKKAVP